MVVAATRRKRRECKRLSHLDKDIELLTERRRLRRWEALERIVAGAPRAVVRVAALACLDDPYDAIRLTATDALAMNAIKRDVPALVRMSHDSYPFVRASAASGLARFDTQASVARLTELLDDQHPLVRSWASAAVATAMPNARAVTLLRRRLMLEVDDYVLVSLYAALLECGLGEYREMLEKLTRHEDPRIRALATKVLGEKRPDAT